MGKKHDVHISLYMEHVTNLQENMAELEKHKYDSSVVTVAHPSVHRGCDFTNKKSCHIGLRADTILLANEWYEKVIPKLSEHLDLESPDDFVRQRDERALERELLYVDHIVQSKEILLKLKMVGTHTNLARLIGRRTKTTTVVEVPMKNHVNVWRNDVDDKKDARDPWAIWNDFRMAAGFSSSIKLALVLTEDLPSPAEIRRWLGESIAYIIIPKEIFVKNSRNYPVLSRRHMEVVKELLHVTSNFMIKANHSDKIELFSDYIIEHVCKSHLKTDLMTGYENLLEIPLQPLFHNLDCYTYEIFERDPVKYKLYQDAIEAALLERVPVGERETKTQTIMVVGGGRGPLVRASINAMNKTGIKVKIIVIEKNPNAHLALEENIAQVWTGYDVTLFCDDMRDCDPSEKADIIVSELLGSFGDNELSPECLDGAQKHLKKDGISIPSKSVSFINPVMSQHLYNGCRTLERYRPAIERANSLLAATFESAYVVYPKHVYHIDEPKEVFTFVHPNYKNPDNSRACKLNFTAETDSILHGFLGYFESVLYKDIKISIHPKTHTIGMSSWFAFYFPIIVPQHVRAGQEIEANIWRCVSLKKVWYEWNVSKPIMTSIHNMNGDSSNIMK